MTKPAKNGFFMPEKGWKKVVKGIKGTRTGLPNCHCLRATTNRIHRIHRQERE